MIPRSLLYAAAAVFCASPVLTQTHSVVVLRGATIHTAAGDPIRNGTIVVREGKIAAVGQGIPVPSGAQVYDLSGKEIIPGMMDSHSHIGALPTDLNDRPMLIGPQHRFIDALNLEDEEFEQAIKGGVTTLLLGPGSGENVSGQAIIIKSFGGKNLEKRLVTEKGGLKWAMGAKSRERYPTTTMGVAANLRQYLIKTQEYVAAWQKWSDNGENGNPPARDLGYEAMAEVLNGQNRVRSHVHSATDVMTLLRLKDEFGFHLTIDHSTEAYKVADELATRDVGAVVLPLGDRIGLSEDVMEGPYILWKAGVRIAMHTDAPVINQKWLRLCAAMAMRYGIPEEEALKTVTINPAILARVSDRVGSIEVGKDADLVVFNGPWYEPKSRVDLVFGDGELVYDRSTEEK